MNIETGKTPTEQDYLSFKTKYDETCTLVACKELLRCAIREQGDISMQAPFTHFTCEQVKAILPYLQAYAETGTFDLSKPNTAAQENNKPAPLSRDQLGEYVRIIEIELTYEQAVEEPSLSETMLYRDLPEADKEKRRRIGEFVANVLFKNHHPLDIYQEEVKRTVATKGYGDTLAMTAMGLAGEVGEVVDILKKHLWHGRELDRDALARDAGDAMWHLAALCNALDVPLRDIIDKNIEKLRERYPNGFDPSCSINREKE